MPLDYCRQYGKFKKKGTYTLSKLEVISKIEKHSLAALPALRSEKYDGWCLRFAEGHTRRANSVNVLEPGEQPLEQKITYCETAYEKAGQACHFRLTPLADDALDTALEERGYEVFDPTEVRILPSLATSNFAAADRVLIENRSTEPWLEALARLTGLTREKQAVFVKMINLTPLRPYFASISQNGRIVSCGLGIGSDDFMGLFEFATDPDFRRQGMARDITRTLLANARKQGTDTAYLQVVKSNTAGADFWRDMGFDQCLYSYHYRSRLEA